jgi:hypothetical protein
VTGSYEEPVSKLPAVGDINYDSSGGDLNGITNLLKNQGFLDELKNMLLGLSKDPNTGEIKPSQLRRCEHGDRVDFIKNVKKINCKNCKVEVTELLLRRCPTIITQKFEEDGKEKTKSQYCGKILTRLGRCSSCGTSDESPILQCPYCNEYANNLEITVETIKFTNDAALMNQIGASEITGLLKTLNHPLSHLGATSDHYVRHGKFPLQVEIGIMLISNYERYNIRPDNVMAVVSTIFNFIDKISNLNVTDEVKSLIDHMTTGKMIQEQRNFQHQEKKGGWRV